MASSWSSTVPPGASVGTSDWLLLGHCTILKEVLIVAVLSLDQLCEGHIVILNHQVTLPLFLLVETSALRPNQAVCVCVCVYLWRLFRGLS